jgi:hypothetical protein
MNSWTAISVSDALRFGELGGAALAGTQDLLLQSGRAALHSLATFKGRGSRLTERL